VGGPGPLAPHPLKSGHGVGDGNIRKSVGQFLLALHTYYSSISILLPEILDCRFQWGLRNEPPILGKGRPYGVVDGAVRKSVGEFL